MKKYSIKVTLILISILISVIFISVIFIPVIFISGCSKKIDYTGFYNYIGEDNGYQQYRVNIHITKDKDGVYTIAIKDGDYATDVIMMNNKYDFGNKYHGSFTYDGRFKQGKTYSFIAGPTDYPDLDSPYDGDIMVDLQFQGNQLRYKNSKSLKITDKEKFKKSDFIVCDKVVAD